MPDGITSEEVLDSRDNGIYDVATNGPGQQGELPLTDDDIVNGPSGDIFEVGDVVVASDGDTTKTLTVSNLVVAGVDGDADMKSAQNEKRPQQFFTGALP